MRSLSRDNMLLLDAQQEQLMIQLQTGIDLFEHQLSDYQRRFEELSTQELKREMTDTKIIAMSGGGQRGFYDYLEYAGIFGAQKTLKKPFEPSELLQAIHLSPACGSSFFSPTGA